MDTYQPPMEKRFRTALLERAAHLRETLGHETDAALEEARETDDFKDLATRGALTHVEDVQAAHAASQLEDVRAALRRLDEGSYGLCTVCGKAIDLRRLQALPEAEYCATCQSAYERARTGTR